MMMMMIASTYHSTLNVNLQNLPHHIGHRCITSIFIHNHGRALYTRKVVVTDDAVLHSHRDHYHQHTLSKSRIVMAAFLFSSNENLAGDLMIPHAIANDLNDISVD